MKIFKFSRFTKMKENKLQNIIITDIKQIIEQARNFAYKAINFSMIIAYWEIGKTIIEEEQSGKDRAEYGKALIKELSKQLTKEYGKGFNRSNLEYMRKFYLLFPISHAVRGKSDKLLETNIKGHHLQSILRQELSWTHYRLLLKVSDEIERNFYMNEAANSNWTTRQLERQINTQLFKIITASKNKNEILKIANTGITVNKPKDIIKDPLVLEFTGFKPDTYLYETDLEQALIDKLQDFLLELGKGFSFVARQQRISHEGDHYFIDLVFYNYLLKCFVLIDLKVGKLTYQDIGQIDGYVRLYEEKIRQESDSPTIGLILCAEKNETTVKYSLLKDSERIFASKYQFYFPTEKELIEKIEQEKEFYEREKKLNKDEKNKK